MVVNEMDETRKSHIEKLFADINEEMGLKAGEKKSCKDMLEGTSCKERITICKSLLTDPCKGSTSHICTAEFQSTCRHLVVGDIYDTTGCPHCKIPISPDHVHKNCR